MEVDSTTDAAAFEARVAGWLAAHPVEANVLHGALSATLDPRGAEYRDAVWITVTDGDRVVGAAMHTAPHPLFLAPMPSEAPAMVVDRLLDLGRDLPGVRGLAHPATVAATAWTARTGRPHTLLMAEGIHVLDKVTPPTGVPGRARPIEERDLDSCVLPWLDAFGTEVWPGATPPPAVDHGTRLRRDLCAGLAMLWQDGGAPVSFARATAPAAGVGKIGPVYTPPEFRRRGYAAAVTAAATSAALAAGATRCMLYTDLANPTSNGVYRRLGYRLVAEAADYEFS